MSRRGKSPVPFPKGIEVEVRGREVTVKGSKGSQTIEVREGIEVVVADGNVSVNCPSGAPEMRKFHGLYRALICNAVKGLSEGYEKRLELIGVGFRAAVKGKQLDLSIGFSHPTLVDIPEGITVKVEENTKVVISGANAQDVGQFAATVRALRKPEPYKGKGIRYVGEYVRRKAGKAAK